MSQRYSGLIRRCDFGIARFLPLPLGWESRLSASSSTARLDRNIASEAWETLSGHVADFVEHWEADRDPPRLVQFLPTAPAAQRYLILVELVKADLGYQWRWGRKPKHLEDYLAEFPELGSSATVSGDLIYEEFHVRKQAGDPVTVDEMLRRFPGRSAELKRLLSLEAPHQTTAIFVKQRTEEIEPGQQLDDFDLICRLGKGAFATVFLARQRSMQRLVALKVSADEGAEPQTLAQLDHPHIVRVYDQRLLPERNLRLMYMQYLSGGTLQEVVEAVRRLPPRERSGKTLLSVVDRALDQRGESPPSDAPVRHKLAGASWPAAVCWIGARLAAALDYAHRQGVLHRDIKPANVLLAADASPKLVDFNISYSSKLQGATPAAYFGGSLPYMSTEQLEACHPDCPRQPEDLDGRSDVFSLGIVLWEMITGERPFHDELADEGWTHTLEQMIERRQQGIEAIHRAKLPGDCPSGLPDVLARCLAANREERFATAGQLARQLELCLQPRVQQLLRPRSATWREAVRRFPLWTMALVAILPNLCGTLLNIAYNYNAIVAGLDPAVQAAFRDRLLLVVNVIVYSSGIVIMVCAAWPVTGEIRRRRRGSAVGESPAKSRRRALILGDLVAAVSLIGWWSSGVVFSLWVHRLSGDSTIDLHRVRDFVLSHTICGLMAATVSFFMITFVVVRFLFPLLLSTDSQDSAEAAPLARLAARIPWYFTSAVISPLLAVIYLGFIDAPLRAAVPVVGVLGFATFIIPYRLARSIQNDVAALTTAVSPPSGQTELSSSTFDSFWTNTQ